jgi:hypothetical protein
MLRMSRLPSRPVALALSAFLLALSGCSREDPADSEPLEPTRVFVTPPAQPPRYELAADFNNQHPDVLEFVQRFLETCLAGDYSGYRELVSRAVTPLSQDRFVKVYHGIRLVTIESVALLPKSPARSDDMYYVITRIAFDPDSKISLRRESERVAILVFREGNDWRMAPAPADLQPQDAKPADDDQADSNEPPLPDYPWDRDVDY